MALDVIPCFYMLFIVRKNENTSRKNAGRDFLIFRFRFNQMQFSDNLFFFFRPLHEHRQYEGGEGEEGTSHKCPFKADNLCGTFSEFLRHIFTVYKTVCSHGDQRDEHGGTDSC